MTVRLAASAHPGDKTTIFHAHQKVAHRASPDVTIEAGNHNVDGGGLEPIRAWHPIEVLHFSFRSVAQLERKAGGGWVRNVGYEPTLHQLLLDEALREDRVAAFFDSFVGRRRGTLAWPCGWDSCGRHAASRRAARRSDLARRAFAAGGRPQRFTRPDVAEDALYAGEASTLVEIDGIVRAEDRVEALERASRRSSEQRRLAAAA